MRRPDRPTKRSNWWKRAAIWLTPGAAVLLAIVGALSLRAPVPAEAYQQCLKSSQEHRAKHAECKSDETLWQRTLSDPVAYYTLWLTLFTAALAITGVAQWVFINREFNTTHRPKLRVRNINVKSVGDAPIATTNRRLRNLGVGEVFGGQFYVANIGSGEARILDGYLMFYATGGRLPMARPYEGKNGNLAVPGGWIASGGSVPVLFNEPLAIAEPSSNSFVTLDNTGLYALGWVEYEDRSGSIRRSAFARQYDPGGWRFMTPSHPDHDYESEE